MPPTVFLSYCHADEAWKDRLVKHLAGLERDGRLRVRNDRLIRAGQKWLQEIETAMSEKLGELGRAAAMMQVYVDYLREIGHSDAEKLAARVEALHGRMDSG